MADWYLEDLNDLNGKLHKALFVPLTLEDTKKMNWHPQIYWSRELVKRDGRMVYKLVDVSTNKGCDEMLRKRMTFRSKDGRSIRVSIGARTVKRWIDPSGILTHSSDGLSPESQKAFSEWKQKVQSGETHISYP